jgi:hypothetical protein
MTTIDEAGTGTVIGSGVAIPSRYLGSRGGGATGGGRAAHAVTAATITAAPATRPISRGERPPRRVTARASSVSAPTRPKLTSSVRTPCASPRRPRSLATQRSTAAAATRLNVMRYFDEVTVSKRRDRSNAWAATTAKYSKIVARVSLLRPGPPGRWSGRQRGTMLAAPSTSSAAAA